jgi:hypothetical protein
MVTKQTKEPSITDRIANHTANLRYLMGRMQKLIGEGWQREQSVAAHLTDDDLLAALQHLPEAVVADTKAYIAARIVHKVLGGTPREKMECVEPLTAAEEVIQQLRADVVREAGDMQYSSAYRNAQAVMELKARVEFLEWEGQTVEELRKDRDEVNALLRAAGHPDMATTMMGIWKTSGQNQ